MKTNSFDEKLEAAITTAHLLFERQKVTGSTGNISFLHEGLMFVSAGGSSFGALSTDSFVPVDLSGAVRGDIKPSKEYPLHLALYKHDPQIEAVIHTHSFYSALWSCLPDIDEKDAVPSYTPYLSMKLGPIRRIPYAPPGSKQLFSLFAESLNSGRGYLLANHGPVVAGTDIHDAFYALEELEESAHLAWELRRENIPRLGIIS
jgi:ribulose-5-phosphate 4-epimerase/fuculose-1-phosphate aldolase